MSTATQDSVIEALKDVVDPELGSTLSISGSFMVLWLTMAT